MKFDEPCLICGGSGHVDLSPNEPDRIGSHECRRCHGTGRIRYEIPDEEIERISKNFEPDHASEKEGK